MTNHYIILLKSNLSFSPIMSGLLFILLQPVKKSKIVIKNVVLIYICAHIINKILKIETQM